MKITLSYSEIINCLTMVAQTQVFVMKENLKPTYGQESNFFDRLNIASFGFMGELVVAKFFNKYWFGNVGIIGGDDVDNLQVRTIINKKHSLILHKEDKDESKFILVSLHNFPEAELVGWDFAGNLKRPENWQTWTGRPCYFIKQDRLRPVRELLDEKTYSKIYEPRCANS